MVRRRLRLAHRAQDLGAALLEQQRLKDVEVLVYGGEADRDLFDIVERPTGEHLVDVPREHLLVHLVERDWREGHGGTSGPSELDGKRCRTAKLRDGNAPRRKRILPD